MSDLLSKASLVMIPSGYKEDVVYSPVPTDGSGDLSFTRASNGTRINSAGLVEDCPWNLLTYSEEFNNAAWAKSITTITANTIAAPNGTTTADKLNESATNSFQNIFQTVSQLAQQYTLSVYLKKGQNDRCVLFAGSSQALLWIDMTNWTSFAQTNVNSYSINAVGNDWYRVVFTYTNTTSGSHQTGLNLVQIGTTNTVSYAGNATNGVYIWGAQLNIGSTAKPYFPTTDRLNVPRLTYQNGGGGCPSLLLEPQRTNLVTYSEQFDNAAWTKLEASISANATTSPDGTANADKIIANTNNAYHLAYITPTVSNSTTYTGTIYVKASEYSKVYFRSGSPTPAAATFDLSTGTLITTYGSPVSATITSVGNGWYRISLTHTTAAVLGTWSFNIIGYPNTGATIDASACTYIGNGTSGIFIWGAQLEASSYATSYIPTTSASATRVADACSKTGISSLIGQTSGSVFFDFTVDTISAQTNNPVLWYMKDGGTGERYVQLNSNGNLGYTENNGSVIASIVKSGLTVGRHKCAIAYANNDMVFYVDGVQIGTDTSGTPSAFSTFAFQYYNASFNGQQNINAAILFPTRLTNAELISLTTL